MFEIREWTSKGKIIIFNKISLSFAFDLLKDLKNKKPKKHFSIFRSLEGRSKNDYLQ